MALQIAYIVDYAGLTLPAAYLRVNRVYLSPVDTTAHITLGIYADEAVRWSGKAPVSCRIYEVNPTEYLARFAPPLLDKMNPIARAYQFLKERLPELAGAVDV